MATGTECSGDEEPPAGWKREPQSPPRRTRRRGPQKTWNRWRRCLGTQVDGVQRAQGRKLVNAIWRWCPRVLGKVIAVISREVVRRRDLVLCAPDSASPGGVLSAVLTHGCQARREEDT